MNGNNIGEGDAQPGRRLYELYYAEASSKPSLQEVRCLLRIQPTVYC